MSDHQRGLILRGLLACLGFLLAVQSLLLKPNIQISLPSFQSSGWSDNYDNYDSSPSSSPDYDSGGGWDFGSSSDSGWDSGGGGWDSGGDSGSWDSGGGDSGSW